MEKERKGKEGMDEKRRKRKRREGKGRERLAWDGQGRTRWDGMGWTGQDRKGWVGNGWDKYSLERDAKGKEMGCEGKGQDEREWI